MHSNEIAPGAGIGGFGNSNVPYCVPPAVRTIALARHMQSTPILFPLAATTRCAHQMPNGAPCEEVDPCPATNTGSHRCSSSDVASGAVSAENGSLAYQPAPCGMVDATGDPGAGIHEVPVKLASGWVFVDAKYVPP